MPGWKVPQFIRYYGDIEYNYLIPADRSEIEFNKGNYERLQYTEYY